MTPDLRSWSKVHKVELKCIGKIFDEIYPSKEERHHFLSNGNFCSYSVPLKKYIVEWPIPRMSTSEIETAWKSWGRDNYATDESVYQRVYLFSSYLFSKTACAFW